MNMKYTGMILIERLDYYFTFPLFYFSSTNPHLKQGFFKVQLFPALKV